MASGELLKQLFRSYARRQDEDFRAAALRIIAEEKQKNHHVLATQLERILMNGVSPTSSTSGPSSLEDLPKDRERNSLLLEIRTPNRYLDEIILTQENLHKVLGVLKEYRRGEILKTHGLRARSKLLLCGPPGCGKTLCAEVIASELGLPILYTRFDSVVSSYLGETSANLRKVFDFASRGTWVLFFDEFDAIGKSREDPSEHGELKRVVNSFLQILDGFLAESLVIAATNHEGLLDRALWRRFDEIIYFRRPTVPEIAALLHKKLANYPHDPQGLRELAQKVKGLSHADVERICLNAVRSSIVDDTGRVTTSSLNDAALAEKKRLRLTTGVARAGAR